jgi:outer membrane protein assembly factor BamB
MTVIELGEVSSSGEDPDEQPPPRLTRRLVRQVALAVTGGLTALLVTGSAVPEPRGIRPLWSTPSADGDGTMIVGDIAYLQETTPSGVRLTARALATGTVRWTVERTESIGYVRPVVAAGILLLPADRHAVALPQGNSQALTAEFHRETIALDARTGAVRWRAAGQPHTHGPDTVLLEEYAPDGNLARVRLVRLTDGGTVWARATPGVAGQITATRDDVPERFITVTGTGELTVHRYDDGSVVTRTRIPWVKPRPEEGYYNDLAAQDDFLVINKARRDTMDLDVYRIDTMTRLWGADHTNGYAFFGGAGRICLNEPDGIVARDIVTGRKLWELGGPGQLWPVTEDRLLMDDGVDDGYPVLLDAATGEILGSGARGTTVWSPEPTDVLVLMRPTRQPPNRTSITLWNVRTGRQSLLGATDFQTGQRCQANQHYLICHREGRLHVTAVG